MEAFSKVRSVAVPLLIDHIDTDQIIPARFLTTVESEGLGQHLFAEWRKRPNFVLSRPEYRGASLLLTGQNFGCGSSREHAPWALKAFGFRAIIARSFADIFRANCLRNGILPVSLPASHHERLVAAVEARPLTEVDIDLVDQTVQWPGVHLEFEVDAFARECLLKGLDPIGYLLTHLPAIEAFEQRHDA